MKVLITGNMGYIGSQLVKYLRIKYPSIYIVGYDTAFFAHCLTNSEKLPESFVNQQLFGDIREFPENILSDVDTVIHLAAISNDPIGNEFEQITDDINHKATLKIAKLALSNNVKNFVYASSCSIYGAAEGGPRKETDKLNPLTAYAKSKVASEIGLNALENSKMVITALRFSTACGMTDRLRLDLVLNDFVASALLTNEIVVLSDGSPWRPLINVKDMCRAIDWASFRSVINQDFFLAINIGINTWNYQIKDLANVVAQIVPETLININTSALPDKRSYSVDFSLFKILAPDYQPLMTLQETVNELMEGIKKLELKDKDFRNSQLIRFNVLKKIISSGRLSKELTWIN